MIVAASFLAGGTLLVALGAVLAIRPDVTSYVANNYNRKTARWLADHGIRYFLADFPNEERRMRIFLPAILIVVGAGWCLFGLQQL